MATMTGEGIQLGKCGSVETIVVALGDRVRLSNGWTGQAHCWTEDGVCVRLEQGGDVLTEDGDFLVWGVDAGDGDIEEIIETIASIKARMANGK